MAFAIGQSKLDCSTLYALAKEKSPKLEFKGETRKRVNDFRRIVDQNIASGKTIYGINTGFGLLSDVKINANQLEQLQVNLVRSHACGVGKPASETVSRALMILRAHTFALGFSGVSESLIETVLNYLQHDILPIIPEQGSVGASGDLAPLAHLALSLIGEGRVYFEGKIVPTEDALKKTGVKPASLKPKEGLSLINGTHFTTTLAALALVESSYFIEAVDGITALSLDAMKGTVSAFDPRIHAARPQDGQRISAEKILSYFEGKDEIRDSHANCGKVQDPYSFRCAPQVHGAARNALKYVNEILLVELNSVTDNPLVFENGDVISGGNFHAQPIAQAMDFLGIALTDIGTIIERRIEKLTNPTMSGLPAFLIKDSGLNSGFMIPHVVAAALASENKTLAHPASVDTIPTSADKEDHVSMGPWAALKAHRILDNCFRLVAIESLAAAQGIDLLKPLKPAPKLKKIYDTIRTMSSEMLVDRSIADDIERISDWIRGNGVTKCIK